MGSFGGRICHNKAMTKKLVIRSLYGFVILCCLIAAGGIKTLLESKQYVFSKFAQNSVSEVTVAPFPVSVDPQKQTITTEDQLKNYSSESFAYVTQKPTSWEEKVVAMFASKEWYQSLASPVSRILVIWPGERKEEVARDFGDILLWNTSDRQKFLDAISSSQPNLSEGKYYPGQYVAHRDSSPEEVAQLVQDKFQGDIMSRYTTDVQEKVPLEQALTVASLLEHEASDFDNMREISGVIWNRLFNNMPLQLDATLQYVKGSKQGEKDWWPIPRPADKYLKSPFNTYANKGLPPAPIGNPSAAAVLAALNPLPTTCVYYFHDKNHDYHCSVTYEEHVAKLRAMYGRGR
jgi:cell division protein YceG involved in septum cleavage